MEIKDLMLADIRELAIKSGEACNYCKHYIPCLGKECKHYVQGVGAFDKKGCKHDWQWCCMDFRYGECDVLENTPCNGCIQNHYSNFAYKNA